MRKALVFWLITLLSITSSARAQNRAFPSCSETELLYVLEARSAYDALVDSLNVSEDSIDGALRYSAAQIEWREDFWTGLPHCAEAIEVAALMSHISSDLGAMAALTYSGVSLSLNRYKDRLFFEDNLRDRLEAQFEGIAALIESADRPAEPSPGERNSVVCVDADIQSLTVALLESQDLIVSAFDIRSSGQLLDYIGAKLEWRDQVWDQLPPCAESVEIGRLMSQTSSDVATAIAYSYAGVSPTENPFGSKLEDELNQLGQWLEKMLARSSGESGIALAETEDANLPRCTDQALAVLVDSLSGASDLVESSFDIESTSGLLAFGREAIAWRKELFSRLPYCAEAVEIGLLVANFLADIVSALALGYADIPADDNPFWDETSANLPQVHEALDRLTGSADLPESVPDTVAVLPLCTQAERETFVLFGAELQLYEDQAASIETTDDLLSFSRAHLFMRNTWRYLPPCQEAIRTGLLLIELTADSIPAAAFHFFAGLPPEENPYWDQPHQKRASIYELLEAFLAD